MRIDADWVRHLAQKYGKTPKEVRDQLWPEHPTRSLSYLNTYENFRVFTVEKIADVIGCTLDELVRREVPYPTNVSGNNNQVGNVHINSDVKSLNSIIESQKKLIKHQESEIQRISDQMKQQLKVKDEQIDRLIHLAQGNGNH
jgi:NADPH-dependent 7-cyano-7-deazaguanine reductase QueF